MRNKEDENMSYGKYLKTIQIGSIVEIYDERNGLMKMTVTDIDRSTISCDNITFSRRTGDQATAYSHRSERSSTQASRHLSAEQRKRLHSQSQNI
jgi:hypothetical protein